MLTTAGDPASSTTFAALRTPERYGSLSSPRKAGSGCKTGYRLRVRKRVIWPDRPTDEAQPRGKCRWRDGGPFSRGDGEASPAETWRLGPGHPEAPCQVPSGKESLGWP